ncbi:MAG: hypothetical protein VW600_17375, partial [Ferrovibrio sp.]
MNEQSRVGREVPLHRIAHGRTGDKGNRLNVSVIAYRPEFFPILRERLERPGMTGRELRQELLAEARRIHEEDADLCRRIGEAGAPLVA